MKMDLIASGSHFTPLIRLYDVDVEPLRELSRRTEELSRQTLNSVDVNKIPGLIAIDDCRLTLHSIARRPRSLVVQDSGIPSFAAHATCEDWLTVHYLLEGLLVSDRNSGAHQWLLGGDARGLLSGSSVALLVSTRPDGSW